MMRKRPWRGDSPSDSLLDEWLKYLLLQILYIDTGSDIDSRRIVASISWPQNLPV